MKQLSILSRPRSYVCDIPNGVYYVIVRVRVCIYYIRAVLAGNSSYSLIQLNNSFSHQCAFTMFLFLSLENTVVKIYT